MSQDTLTFLDVNAAAGELNQLFTLDVTRAIVQCDSCDKIAPLAESYLYAMEPGMVVRCNGCQRVLMRIVTNAANVWADLRGLRYLQLTKREPEL
jgi:hypothetical protein